ncbi:hypothetical protein Saso_60380 [Streptomyces asoensis]|uniref:Uncharacterized protein n=1 Tax=Streptomyces asoensis TaxID=249586 RepID=A0ABQ3S8C6_9ACTN|nr:hypothetical protein GCM10010496_54490 [Streptomyces asoensis]GHI64388.1 hypothetical protein Saso_60380 [Streptomyces asoensis]
MGAVAVHTPIEAAVRATAPVRAARGRLVRWEALTAAMTVLRTVVTDVRGSGAATLGLLDRSWVKPGRTAAPGRQSSSQE